MSHLLIANWKAHKTTTQAAEWVQSYAKASHISASPRAQVVVAPAFTLLPEVSAVIKDSKSSLQMAVQDLSPFPAGAYTGAVSTEQLKTLDVKYAILGHSERRRYFHETHQDVANKVEQAVAAGITPVVCVDSEYVVEQAAAIARELLAKCVVAYEPLEAIGTGESQPVEQVRPVVENIKHVFGQVKVIYGGSVKADNAVEYLTVTDGLLVGGASLNSKDWLELVAAAEQA